MLGMVLFARGFRPFFLLAGAHAVVFMLIWIALLDGWGPAHGSVRSSVWHAHEMIFGFCAAAIAGFLLTSVPVWTGTVAVTGLRLGALVVLWLAGRVAMLIADRAPISSAIVDFTFLPALAVAIGPAIYRAGTPRNFGFPLVLLALACANALVLAEGLGLGPGTAAIGLRAGVDLVALLVVVIGGRIVPSFTTNALRRAGVGYGAQAPVWAERAAVPSFLLFAAADVVLPASPWSGVTAALSATVLAARMTGWRTFRVLRDPLLGSLHLGHAWIVIGLASLAASDLDLGWPRSLAVHALTAGGFGTMILAVMTRVALGHTGRPLVAPLSARVAYVLVTGAALLRTAGVAAMPTADFLVLTVAGAFWSGAFAVFLGGYAQVLMRPRVDGKPG
jgi:uncharacterized protein involved in response to NO